MNSNNTDISDITKKKIIAEYVWPDLNGNLRSKIKIIQKRYLNSFTNLEDFPIWNFDGSSTGQSLFASASDVIIRPVRLYKNPLIISSFESVLVLCECLNKDLSPRISNTRAKCEQTSEQFEKYDCLFGIEQEYTILERNGDPYKWINQNSPGLGNQGPYYCSVGGDRAFGREIVDEHMLCCLNAGIHICGTNAEVMPSQWEFQIGTCDMLTASDDLLVARFFLHKITEKYNCCVSFHPKLFTQWNGSGGHTNFSTKQMREKNGKKYIVEACEKLAKKHTEHIVVYGIDNDKRLTGNHETSDINIFSWGELNRNCSIRIPLQVCMDNCGYLEDRRPASNMDPYLVTEIMVKTICSE
jgi:glutamine synthetase